MFLFLGIAVLLMISKKVFGLGKYNKQYRT